MSHLIESRVEIDYLTENDFCPFFYPEFEILPALRKAYLKELFRANTQRNNVKFYRWVWRHYPLEHKCEECFRPLYEYSATFVSHIITKANAPHIAYEPMNTNLLCGQCHHNWDGRKETREKMRIFPSNQLRIEWLLSIYGR